MGIKKGIVYVFIANAINLIIGLFTGFVLPKLLSVDTYANIRLFQLYVSYVTVLHLGFSDGMYLRLGGKSIDKVDKKEVREEFKTFKIFQVIEAIIAIIISLILKNQILLFCALVILPINIGDYLRQVYQATGLFKKYSIFTNVNTVLIFVVNVLLLLVIKTDDSIKYIVGYIIVYMIYWISIEIEARKIFGKEKVKANIKYFVQNIRSGFLLLIGNFCNNIFTGIDRIFVQALLGKIKFAVYSFAASIENLMSVFVTPISTVMYNYLSNRNGRDDVLRIKKIIVLLAAIIIAVVFPAKFVIQTWIQKYNDVLNVLFILFAAQYITIMVRCVHINTYKVRKQQQKYFIIMLFIVGLSVILNIILFLMFRSIEAIAVATLITSTVWFIIGEIDFKEYRLDLKNYIFIFSILIIFLICGQIPNSIIGCIAYVISAIVISFVLMKDAIKMTLTEGKDLVMQVVKNKSKQVN